MSWEDIRRIYFKDETEESYIEGVRMDGSAIRLIENPSERVCLEAIRWDPEFIKYIENPTFAIYKAAIEKNEFIYCKVDIPDDVLTHFLDKHPEYIMIMKNPSLQDNLKVLNISCNNPSKHNDELGKYFWKLMSKLSEEDSLKFIEINPHLFDKIKQPTVKQIYTYLKHRPRYLRYLEIPKRAEKIPPAEIPSDDSEI